MRMIVLEPDADLQDLLSQVTGSARPATDATDATLERLRTLNPHLDFARLQAGSVVLVPDHPDFQAGQATSIGGEAFDSLASDAASGLKAASARIRSGFQRQEERHKEVAAAFRSAAFKRLSEADEALRKQAAEADARFKSDAKRGTDTAAQLEEMTRALQQELKSLGRLLG